MKYSPIIARRLIRRHVACDDYVTFRVQSQGVLLLDSYNVS